MKKIILLLSLLLAILPLNNAKADDYFMNIFLTCDQDKNIAMLRFQAGYKNFNLPKDLQEKFGYLNDLSVQSDNECTLSDGRKIKVINFYGQAFAYGQGGGNGGAYFIFRIDSKYIFYKAYWHGRGMSYQINPAVMILDNQKLISCKGPENNLQDKFEDYQIKSEECADISNRLVDDLTGAELKKYEEDIKIQAYEPIAKDKKLCEEIENAERLHSVPLISHRLGQIHNASDDINNDRNDERIYIFENLNNYMHGSYIVYFKSDNRWNFENEEEKAFLKCMVSDQCPEAQERTYDSVNQFVTEVEQLWEGARVISAASIPKEIAGAYRVRYTQIVPYKYGQDIYLYFSPTNYEIHPRAVLGKLNKDNELEIMCTYKKDIVN